LIKLRRNSEYTLRTKSNNLIRWHKEKTTRFVLWHKKKQLRLACNDSTALIWQIAAHNLSVTKIADHVQQSVQGDIATIRRDIYELTDDLIKHGILIEDTPLGATRGKVYVSYLGRLGNNLFNYTLGRILANELGFELHTRPIEGFPNTIHKNCDSPPAITESINVQVLDDCEESLDPVVFDKTPRPIHIHGYFQRYHLDKPYKAEIRNTLLKPDFVLPKTPGPQDLVVHIRSGDVWSWNRSPGKRSHIRPLTAQYYESIINISKYESLFIVCENKDDPIALYLQYKYRAELISGDILEDFGFLMAAKQIVMSASTFSWWAAWLSTAEVIHFPLSNYLGANNKDQTRGTNLLVHDEERYVFHQVDPLPEWGGEISEISRVLSGRTATELYTQENSVTADVIIPVAKSNGTHLDLCIKSIQERLYGANRISIVSIDDSITSERVLSLEIFPFSKKEVALELTKTGNENQLDNVYQELIKLYSPLLENGQAQYVLLVEPDVIFLNTIGVLDNGSEYIDAGGNVARTLLPHVSRLIPSINKNITTTSGCGNFLLVNRKIIRQLQKHIEHNHRLPMWKAYIRNLDNTDIAASIYDLYGSYVSSDQSYRVASRSFNWQLIFEPETIETFREMGCHYICIGKSIIRNNEGTNYNRPQNKISQLMPLVKDYGEFCNRTNLSLLVPFKIIVPKIIIHSSKHYMRSEAIKDDLLLNESSLYILDKVTGRDSIDSIIKETQNQFPKISDTIRTDILLVLYTLLQHRVIDIRVQWIQAIHVTKGLRIPDDYASEIEDEVRFRCGRYYNEKTYCDPLIVKNAFGHNTEGIVQIRNGKIHTVSNPRTRTAKFAHSILKYIPASASVNLFPTFGDGSQGANNVPHIAHSRPVGYDNVILWPLQGYQTIASSNYGMSIHQYDIPWDEKISIPVWRGSSTGMSIYNRTSDEIRALGTKPSIWKHKQSTELRQKANRLQLVQQYLEHPTINVGFSGFCQMDNYAKQALTDRHFKKDRKHFTELLNYKFLIVVEGNDYPSQLPWALHSNSLVLTPPAVFENIIFRSLQPWVHFVPLSVDFSDLEEKLEWCRINDKRCKEISQKATTYMRDYYSSLREDLIRQRMVDIYIDNYHR